MKKIRSETIYEGKVFNVRRDLVKIDDKTIVKEVVEHPGASAILPILEDGRILLIKQYRHPIGEVIFEIPAGTLERDEDPEKCAIRELKEETGYAAGKISYLTTLYLAPGYSSERLHIYLAKNLRKGEQRLEEDEEIDVIKMRLEDAVEAIKSGKIKDAKTIAAILLYAKITPHKN